MREEDAVTVTRALCFIVPIYPRDIEVTHDVRRPRESTLK